MKQILLRVQSQRPGLYSWRERLPILIHGTKEYIDVTTQGRRLAWVGGDLLDTRVWDGHKWAPRVLEKHGSGAVYVQALGSPRSSDDCAAL